MWDMDEVYGGAGMRPATSEHQRKTVFTLPAGAKVSVVERALVADSCSSDYENHLAYGELLMAMRLDPASVDQYRHALDHDPYHYPDDAEPETNRTIAEILDDDVDVAEVDTYEERYYILVGNSDDALPHSEVELLSYGESDTMPPGTLRDVFRGGMGGIEVNGEEVNGPIAGGAGCSQSPSLLLPCLHDCNRHFSTEGLGNGTALQQHLGCVRSPVRARISSAKPFTALADGLHHASWTPPSTSASRSWATTTQHCSPPLSGGSAALPAPASAGLCCGAAR